MSLKKYTGPERREFVRVDYASLLDYKVCKKETISKLLRGYITDISQTGLLCRIKERVNKDDILWLSFDRATLNICADLEKKALIYQGGIIAKVVRLQEESLGSYNIGVQFITREEKNLTHIFPKVHFLGQANEDE
jgi:c-di-GMP-binding flagellar brake protein YcgR